MDLRILMTIHHNHLFFSPKFPPTISFPPSFSTQKPKSLLPHTMNDPRTQFSHTYDHSYGNPFGNNDRRLSQNNESCSNWSTDQEVVQFRPNHHHQEAIESDDSGVCSPPLWKNSPSPSRPLLSHHIYRNLSPNSRVQAIARGQRELMEMVKNMPESSYELSLKDLVEHHKMENHAPQVNNLQNLHQRGVVKVKRQESKKNDKNMMRSESFENKGLFLKMVFPFSLKSKKKKNFASNSSGKVSPKPEVVKGGGGGEKDWWKKKFTGSSDSDSSRTSNNSGSTESSSGGGSSTGRSYSGGRRYVDFFASLLIWRIMDSDRFSLRVRIIF